MHRYKRGTARKRQGRPRRQGQKPQTSGQKERKSQEKERDTASFRLTSYQQRTRIAVGDRWGNLASEDAFSSKDFVATARRRERQRRPHRLEISIMSKRSAVKASFGSNAKEAAARGRSIQANIDRMDSPKNK